MRWSISPTTSPTTAAGRCMSMMPTSSKARSARGSGARASPSRRSTARPMRSTATCASSPTTRKCWDWVASSAARKPAQPTRPPTCSSSSPISIRSVRRAPAASSIFSPMRASDSSAASIRPSWCEASSLPRGWCSTFAAAPQARSRSPASRRRRMRRSPSILSSSRSSAASS